MTSSVNKNICASLSPHSLSSQFSFGNAEPGSVNSTVMINSHRTGGIRMLRVIKNIYLQQNIKAIVTVS